MLFSFIIVVMPVDNKCRDFYVYWKKKHYYSFNVFTLMEFDLYKVLTNVK